MPDTIMANLRDLFSHNGRKTRLSGSGPRPPNDLMQLTGTMRRYDLLAAVALVLAAFLLRHFGLPSLGMQAPYIMFYPALTLAALLGGWRAGLLATLLSAIIADFFWIAPVGTFYIASPADIISIGIFMSSGALITWVADGLNRANTQLRDIERVQSVMLQTQVAEATAALRQSERRLKTALTGSSVSAWEQDLAGTPGSATPPPT
jgi:K+-sensing histidine kinase KdpD